MKLWYALFVILSILIISSGCTVDDSTGLITISNHSNIAFLGVRLGSTLLATVSPGYKADYWFYNNMSGGISIEGVDEILVAKHSETESGDVYYEDSAGTIRFKTGYRYEIRITKVTVYMGMYSDSLVIAYVEPGIKSGGNKSRSDFYHFPAK